MAKPYKIPDFRKMYPEASEEVIAVLRTSERKMQYQEYDLKRARNIVDPKTGEKMTIPSREDSYERLQEMAAGRVLRISPPRKGFSPLPFPDRGCSSYWPRTGSSASHPYITFPF